MRKEKTEISAPKKGSVTRFLTSRDASIGTKNILGMGIVGSLVALAFTDRDGLGNDIIEQIIPSVEGHTSTISNSSGQGLHSSHGNHSSSGDSGSGSGDGGGDGGDGG